MVFIDSAKNKYYTIKDELFVDLPQRNQVKRIGRITENTIKGELTLIIERKKDEATNWGHMVPYQPLKTKNFTKILLIEDNKFAYILDVPKDKFKQYLFTPIDGYEQNVILPRHFWTFLGSV